MDETVYEAYVRRYHKARRMRATCGACGREGLDVPPTTPGHRAVAPACECGGSGYSQREIARVLGVRKRVVASYLTKPLRGAGGTVTGSIYVERRDAAIRLRTTCASCGREGLGFRTTPDGQKRPNPCECGGRGHTLREIAEALGAPISTVGQYISDPNREKCRARHEAYKGTCSDCGGHTENPRNYRCGWCLAGEPSPHRRATSPTGFADHTSPFCGAPSCSNPKRRAGHVCESCWEDGPYRRIRDQLDDERVSNRRSAGRRVTPNFPAALAA